MAPTLGDDLGSALNVRCLDDVLTAELTDGRAISVPLDWYPRLQRATPSQRANWELTGDGYGIHWPDVDEDISVRGLLLGNRNPEASS